MLNPNSKALSIEKVQITAPIIINTVTISSLVYVLSSSFDGNKAMPTQKRAPVVAITGTKLINGVKNNIANIKIEIITA